MMTCAKCGYATGSLTDFLDHYHILHPSVWHWKRKVTT